MKTAVRRFVWEEYNRTYVNDGRSFESGRR